MGRSEGRYREAERRYWGTLGVTPEERWVGLPTLGTRVRLLVLGEGPPVLFVHGTQNAGTSWGSLAARMPNRTSLLLDRPGCGLSPPLTGRRLTDDRVISDVLDGLELDRADLVGTSLGGYHVLRTAATHPERVGRALLFGWTLGAPTGDLPLVMRLAGVRPVAKLMSRMPVGERATRALTERIGVHLPPEGLDWYRALLHDTHTVRNEVDAAAGLLSFRRGLDPDLALTDELLGRIRAPTHFVWGTDDPFGGAEVAGPFVARIPGATLALVPGGHAVWIDDAEGAAAAAVAWLG